MSVFDARDFLKTELGFTDEEIAPIADKFAGDRAEKLGRSVLRQRDYSRQMDKARDEYAAKESQLQAEMAEWANLTAAERASATGLRQQLEQSQADLLRHSQAVNRLAQEAGVDPNAILGGAASPSTPIAPASTPAVDTSQFASTRQMADLASLTVTLPAELLALDQEHREIFGKPLDARAVVAELKTRASNPRNQKTLDLRAIWEEQHNVAETRATQATQKYNADMAAAEARGREKALSESSLPAGPGNMPVGKHAPVFRPNHTSAVNRPAPGQGVQSAIAAFRTGKYRQGGGSTPSA